MRITVHNRGPEPAGLHVLPQLWFRNTWTWDGITSRPSIETVGAGVARVWHRQLKGYHWYAEGAPPLLFCDNDTNVQRLYGIQVKGHFKDAFHIPLFAVEVLEPETLERLPDFKRRLEWFLNYDPKVAALVSHWEIPGRGSTRLLSLLRSFRMKHLLRRMLDETEFLSEYGIRALSRIHAEHPYEFQCNGDIIQVSYWPGESHSGLFGGNSNWRGPIWFPINYLIIDSLRRFHDYYGEEYRIEHPTGSGRLLTLREIADELLQRLVRLFARDTNNHRAVFGTKDKLQHDPHFRDHILFYEFFHGDSGRGVGASHQTGWTGLVANLISQLGSN